MNIRSLALQTDLVMHRLCGDVYDRGDYLAIKTPSSPTYYWGNFLIMPEPPKVGDFVHWLDLSEQEHGSREERGFVAITWDSVTGEEGEVAPFLAEGFTLECCTVLTAKEVSRTDKVRDDLKVRVLESDADWEAYAEIQFSLDWPHGNPDDQRSFLTGQCTEFRKLVGRGEGMRFGVELDGKLVGEAGIYRVGSVARFNAVATHRDFMRQGVCSTLIYRMSQYAFEHMEVDTLVMEADEGYHAGRIYESLGFRPTERNVGLQWYQKEEDG